MKRNTQCYSICSQINLPYYLTNYSRTVSVGRYMIFNIFHTANWEYIKQQKQKIINLNNTRENSKCIPHVYEIGNQVLLKRGTKNKYESPYQSPFNILKVNDNGAVWLIIKSVKDTYNIRRLVPYHSETDLAHGGECNMWTSKKCRKH